MRILGKIILTLLAVVVIGGMILAIAIIGPLLAFVGTLFIVGFLIYALCFYDWDKPVKDAMNKHNIKE